jgi:hypothetical protein
MTILRVNAFSNSEQTKRCAFARPLEGGGIQVVMWTQGRTKEGPWSFIADLPVGSTEMLGPPPIYLALAGWAT